MKEVRKEYMPYDSTYNKYKNRHNQNDGGMKIGIFW